MSDVKSALLQDWNRFVGIAYQVSQPQGAALTKAADVLVAETKEMLSRPGTGRVYKSRGITSALAGKGTKQRATQLHQASAPGEPPAPDTGELRRSIHKEILPGAIRVGTPLTYARPLEFGHVNETTGAVLAARPFMRPSLVEAQDQMTEVLVAELQVDGQRANGG